jgi:hypothetical protein
MRSTDQFCAGPDRGASHGFRDMYGDVLVRSCVHSWCGGLLSSGFIRSVVDRSIVPPGTYPPGMPASSGIMAARAGYLVHNRNDVAYNVTAVTGGSVMAAPFG